jgi:DNA invertase Pin-like site-specific DNA recombinase
MSSPGICVCKPSSSVGDGLPDASCAFLLTVGSATSDSSSFDRARGALGVKRSSVWSQACATVVGHMTLAVVCRCANTDIYYCVSTQRQGASGLGIDAQREAVRRFLNGSAWDVLGEFVEVEPGRKTDEQRPELAKALAECRRHGAVLLVAKLDRLARSVHFVSGLMRAGVKFVAVDLPQVTDLTIHVMAAFAEHETKRISQRTKDALAAFKARGVTLATAGPANLTRNIEQRKSEADDFAEKLRGVIMGMKARGLSQRAMVAELNILGARAAAGGEWSLLQLQRVVRRLEL